MRRIALAFSLLLAFSAAADDVRPAPYGVARVENFRILAADGTYVTNATDGGTDVTLTCDDGTPATATNDFSDEGSHYAISLTAAELQCARLVVDVADTIANGFILETYGHPSSANPTLGCAINGPCPTMGIIDIGQAQAADASSITLRTGFSATAVNMVGVSAYVYSSTNGLHARCVSTAYNNTSKVLTCAGLGEAPTGTVLYALYGTAPGSATSVNLATVEGSDATTYLEALDDPALAAIAALNNLSAADVGTIIIEDQGGGVSLRCAIAVLLAYAAGDIATTGADTDYEDPSGTEERITGTIASPGNRTAAITCPTY